MTWYLLQNTLWSGLDRLALSNKKFYEDGSVHPFYRVAVCNDSHLPHVAVDPLK